MQSSCLFYQGEGEVREFVYFKFVKKLTGILDAKELLNNADFDVSFLKGPFKNSNEELRKRYRCMR